MTRIVITYRPETIASASRVVRFQTEGQLNKSLYDVYIRIHSIPIDTIRKYLFLGRMASGTVDLV
jgi:hypothetical protein